jgi:hypothetical protein
MARHWPRGASSTAQSTCNAPEKKPHRTHPTCPPKVAIVTGAARGIGAAVSFLAREESGFVSGQVIYVAGGPRA